MPLPECDPLAKMTKVELNSVDEDEGHPKTYFSVILDDIISRNKQYSHFNDWKFDSPDRINQENFAQLEEEEEAH
jgi:hypothetical protein